MSDCGCDDGCLPTQVICVPRADDKFLIITVQDQDGNLEDIAGAQEIDFRVWDSFGGTVRIAKTLSGGDIAFSGNDYQFTFWISAAESEVLVNARSYFECKMVNNAGRQQTIGSGLFRAPDTMIGVI